MEINEAKGLPVSKREERKATEPPIQSTQPIEAIEETLKEVIDRARNKFFESEFASRVEEEEKRMTVQHYIPRKYIGCSLETFKGNQRLVDALKVCSKGDESVVIMGNTGCGKTHLAVAMMFDADSDSLFTTAPELLLEIRESFRDSSPQSEREIVDRYSRYPLLVLDDLGAEKSTEWSITTLFLIIDRRIRDCRKTIITTNLTMEQIEQVFGARVASRLSAMRVIRIGMPDYRKKRQGGQA
jgi:DNA replication protein DnaC